MAINAELFLKRFKDAKSAKTNFSDIYEEALEYAAPHRDTFDEETIGQDKTGRGTVYDSSTLVAHQRFASNIQASMTPPMSPWIKLVPGSQIKDTDELRRKLMAITNLMFTHLQNSNFDTQMSEGYLDLAVGTGALLAQKGKNINNPLNFCNVPISQLFIEESQRGIPDTVFRQFKIPLRDLSVLWPDAEIPKDLADELKDKPEKKITLVEGAYPEKVKLFNPRTNREDEVDGYKYAVVAEKGKHVLVERNEKTSPWIVFRWSVLPGETYGRGVLLQAAPDTRTLNKTKELLLQAASIGIFGMYTATDDGTINIENIKFGPGAVIPVESNADGLRGRTLMPLQTSTDVNLAQIVINDLKQSINDIMFAQPLGPVDLPVKTATEVSLRQQELSKRIGSAFGRLQFELISPLVNRILDLLDQQGIIDLGDFVVDGNVIAIQHVSPLALAQNEEDFSNMVRYAQTIVSLFGPQVAMGLLNPDIFSKIIANKLNIPPEMVPTEEEFTALKQALAQQIAANPAAAADIAG
jgi:hypothetical protein